MASKKYVEKSSEVMEKNKMSESIKKLQTQDAALRRDIRLSASPRLIPSPGYTPGGNQDHTNQEPVSGGVYCPPISTYDYFAGCAGVCSNFDTQGYFSSQEGLKIPSSVHRPAGKVFSLNNQGRDQLFQGQGIGRFGLRSQMLMGNDRNKMAGQFNRSRGFDISSELTRGPRANKREASSILLGTKNSLGFMAQREKYNLHDFQTKYKEAKFFMIKSYSEDDIHKSIKYNVWSSTPNGNKKLDAAFREAEARAQETARCPIFLFFSVNSSGQFIGLAEMIGPVDFNKSMNFWQQDKWHGFFPVKWHIIKDIPNSLFRNIVLENNDNREVTYSRDTQEIGLPQGLKMLQIFKDFQVETSILDDFGFYEEKGKALRAQRTALEHSRGAPICNSSSPNLSYISSTSCSPYFDQKHPETETMELTRRSNRSPANPKGSLVALTKNLSLNAHQ